MTIQRYKPAEIWVNDPPDIEYRDFNDMEEDSEGEYVKFEDIPQWVSVEEMLPVDYRIVLLAFENNSVVTGSYIFCNGYTRLKVGNISKNIVDWECQPTHWMPLPDAPTQTPSDSTHEADQE